MLATETCIISLACAERQTEIAYHLCVLSSTRRRGNERGRKIRSETGRRKGKKCEERETTACTMRGTKGKSEREAFIVEKGFGLAFCHPLLTSVQPLLGEFPNVCHPLRLFLLHGQCLSDRSQRQSHGNRDGFTVAGNPCRIYRLHSSGYVFLYLPFRISRPSTPSVLQSRVTTLHRRPEGALCKNVKM